MARREAQNPMARVRRRTRGRLSARQGGDCAATGPRFRLKSVASGRQPAPGGDSLVVRGEPRRRPSARLANRTRRRRTSSRLHDASRSAPRWTRWMQHRGSFGGEDNFKLVGTRRLRGHDKRSVQNAVSATQLPLPIGPWVGGASVARLGPSRFGLRVCSAWVSGSPELPRSAPAGPCAPSARLSFSRPWRAQAIRAASLS